MKIIAFLPIIIIEIFFALAEMVTACISGLFGMIRVWFFKEYDYRRWLKRDLGDCNFILELGCGPNSPILQMDIAYRTDGVDIWGPYVDMHNRQGNYRNCTQGDILDMKFKEAGWDAVVICDVLEHLPKDKVERLKLLDRIEKAAIKKVILFTPNGYIENDEVDGDPWQAHLSAWEPEDFTSRGYKVVGATGFRWLFAKASRPRYHPYSVCSIIGMLSTVLVFHKPKWAWHSYAVKELGK